MIDGILVNFLCGTAAFFHGVEWRAHKKKKIRISHLTASLKSLSVGPAPHFHTAAACHTDHTLRLHNPSLAQHSGGKPACLMQAQGRTHKMVAQTHIHQSPPSTGLLMQAPPSQLTVAWRARPEFLTPYCHQHRNRSMFTIHKYKLYNITMSSPAIKAYG